MEHQTGEYMFFAHKKCEYYPCHPGADPENFNCLFCYCPLYHLGERCGGNCTMTEQGVKDCSGCTFPHRRENYEKLMERLWQNAQGNGQK